MVNNKINKYVILIIGSFISSIVFSTETTGPSTQYTVTMKKMELCTSSACTTAHTLVEKTQAMDIASVDVGASVGSYASTIALPPMGVTYTHMRMTTDRTFTLKGYAASGSGGYCYSNGNAGSSTAPAVGIYTTSASNAETSATAAALELLTDSAAANAITFNDSENVSTGNWAYISAYAGVNLALSGTDDFQYTKVLTTPYTYYGQTPIMDLGFETSTSFMNKRTNSVGDDSGDCNLLPGEPVVTVTIK
jgi:hypothetical protein